ncbi:MAG: AMP-binding protein [Verrucomicrobiae bacterium]|nr:AMP-binding protein [Verrucomicrobiae bacterium]
MSTRNSRLAGNWDRLDRDTVRDLQWKRLKRYLATAVLPFSKHHGRLFAKHGIRVEDLRTWDDWERVPFSSKRDLIAIPGSSAKTRDFVLIPDEAVLKRRLSTVLGALRHGPRGVKKRLEAEFRPILMTSTTGRSTEPVPFLYTQHDLDNLAITGRRLMEICDSRADWRHLNLFPFAPHLAFWQAHYAGLGYNSFCLSTGGGKVMGTDGNVRLLEKIEPDALIGMPTFLYHVLREAVARGVESPNLKRIVLGGEKVPEGMRRKLRALCADLGAGEVNIMATYGMTEAKMAWPECPAPEGAEPGGYHLYPDLGLVEVVDPESGRVVPDGEPGEVVFTPLDARGSVVLRYRTGDLISGGLHHEPCPHCGRTLPRLVGRISRVSDVRRLNIDKIKGTLVNFNDLENVLDDMDSIGAWQIEIRKRNDDPLESDELVVHIAPAERTDRDTLTRAIRKRFLESTEISPNRVEFHDVEAMREMQGVGEKLKEEKVVDHRPKSVASESEAANRDSTPTPQNA